MSLKTILGYLGVAFVIWWVVEAPDSAAHLVHNIGTFLSTAAGGLSNFVSSIGGGGKGYQSSLPGWAVLLAVLGSMIGAALLIWLVAWIIGGTSSRKDGKP